MRTKLFIELSPTWVTSTCEVFWTSKTPVEAISESLAKRMDIGE